MYLWYKNLSICQRIKHELGALPLIEGDSGLPIIFSWLEEDLPENNNVGSAAGINGDFMNHDFRITPLQKEWLEIYFEADVIAGNFKVSEVPPVGWQAN